VPTRDQKRGQYIGQNEAPCRANIAAVFTEIAAAKA
jgi:hypothetical protein